VRRVPGSPFTPDDPVPDIGPIEPLIREMPSSYTVKGMFVAPIANRLGKNEVERLRSTFDAPLRERYLAFRDYPQADHSRLMARLAELDYPGQPPAEALRRFARTDMATFAGSTLGRVIMAVVGDAASALLKVPTVYEKVAPGTEVIARRTADGVTLEFQPVYGAWAYQLGQVEGIAGHYGATSIVDVFEGTNRLVKFDVNLEPNISV